MNQLASHLMGQFPVPTDAKLFEFARQYHEDTETFDRVVCSGKIDGVAYPIDGVERALSGKNAKALYARLLRQALDLGFTPEQWHRAVQEALYDR